MKKITIVGANSYIARNVILRLEQRWKTLAEIDNGLIFKSLAQNRLLKLILLVTVYICSLEKLEVLMDLMIMTLF